ncbi:MAG: hypothetical protein ABI619_11085 [Betaproteobacteria bacterium]
MRVGHVHNKQKLENMDWHRLTIRDDPNPADAAAALIEYVRREHEKAGAAEEFSVYCDDTQPDHPIFFFSPEASAAFPELPYFNAAPCAAPAHPEALARIV